MTTSKSDQQGQQKVEYKNRDRVRLSLDASPQLNETITRLASETGGTKSDVIRKAIVLMELAVDASQQNRKMAIVPKDQIVETEIVGIF